MNLNFERRNATGRCFASLLQCSWLCHNRQPERCLCDLAGFDVSTGVNFVAIGAFQPGVDSALGELNNSCYVSNIAFQPVSSANFAGFVVVDSDGKLGTFTVDANGNQVPLPSPGGQHQAMLNRKVEKQEATIAELKSMIAQQQKQIKKQQKEMEIVTGQRKEQATQIQKISAQP